MSKRPFDFYAGTSMKARFRQEGLCAVCAKALDHEMEYTHHVIPNQCGNPANPEHVWMRTVLNCVVVCHECHMRVHQDGKTKAGHFAPPEYFRWSHKKRQEHRAWAKQVNDSASSIWEYLNSKASKT